MNNIETRQQTNNIKAITIYAKRWFQRSYGNTYHTTEICIDTGHTEPFIKLKSDKTYGYGECWNQTALDLFKTLFPADTRSAYLTSYCKENDIPVFYHVTDVKREKDL